MRDSVPRVLRGLGGYWGSQQKVQRKLGGGIIVK
jgi:hypothetical protein